MIFERIIEFTILLWTFIYIASYARWTWKKKNKVGAVMLFLLALFTMILPIYVMYSRG